MKNSRFGGAGRVFLVAILLIGMMGTVSGASFDEDSFEDQNLNQNPDWDVNNAPSVSSSFSSSFAIDGTYSLKLDTDGSSSGDRWNINHPVSSPKDGSKFDVWMRRDSNNKDTNAFRLFTPSDSLKIIWHRSGDILLNGASGGVNYPSNTWMRGEIKVYPSNNTADYLVEERNGNVLIDVDGVSYSGSFTKVNFLQREVFSGKSDIYVDLMTYSSNNAPSFDSVSTQPSSWTLGSSINVSADVSDSDGTVSGVSADVWENGTQIVSDASLTDSDGDGTWEISNLFTVDESSVEYKIELTATDDDGATSTYTTSQVIEDNLGSITINQPTGSIFDYDVDYSISHSDNDNVPNENITCDVAWDGPYSIPDKKISFSEDSATSGTFRIGVGDHTLNMECSDDAGNTETASQSYNVEDFKVQSVYSPSQVYETEGVDFNFDYRTGDMVNEYGGGLDLYWNGTKTSEFLLPPVDGTDSRTVLKEIPLVSSNNTQVQWRFRARYNASTVDGGWEIRTENTFLQNQDVLWNYYFDQHSLDDGFTQLEASTFNYTSSIVEEKQSTAGVNVEHRYSQTGVEKTGRKVSKTSYYNIFNSNLINSTSSTFNLEANYTVSFNGDTRNIVNSKDVQLDKIVLNKANNGPETLKFETRDEINNSLLDANLEAGITVNNPDQPDKTRFFGFDFSKDKKHELFLSPSDATVTANVFEDRSISYENIDAGFPKRRHYFQDTTLDNETTNINLYLLKESQGSTVRLELTNSDLQGLSNHLIRVERAFPDQNETRTVQLAKTGTQGFASTFLQLQERYIFTVFDEDGNLVDQVGPETVTTTDKRIQVNDGIDPSLANVFNEVQFTDIQRGNQSLSVSYVSDTQRLNNLFLKISSDGLFETKTLDVDSSEQPQGQLEVNDFNASEQKVFFELIGKFGETNLTLESGTFGQESNDFGNAGIFVSFLMFTALTLSGLFRPSAAIGLGVISIFVMSFTGFLAVGQQALISIAALAAVLIWRMSSQ